jgi:hypothetical protein
MAWAQLAGGRREVAAEMSGQQAKKEIDGAVDREQPGEGEMPVPRQGEARSR